MNAAHSLHPSPRTLEVESLESFDRLVAAYPGDWENVFRPEPQDVNTYSSCKE